MIVVLILLWSLNPQREVPQVPSDAPGPPGVLWHGCPNRPIRWFMLPLLFCYISAPLQHSPLALPSLESFL